MLLIPYPCHIQPTCLTLKKVETVFGQFLKNELKLTRRKLATKIFESLII